MTRRGEERQEEKEGYIEKPGSSIAQLCTEAYRQQCSVHLPACSEWNPHVQNNSFHSDVF